MFDNLHKIGECLVELLHSNNVATGVVSTLTITNTPNNCVLKLKYHIGSNRNLIHLELKLLGGGNPKLYFPHYDVYLDHTCDAVLAFCSKKMTNNVNAMQLMVDYLKQSYPHKE